MANIFHRIKAYLYKNLLTDDPNDYIIRVMSERTLNVREVSESAVARGGADITPAAMEHATNLWFKEMGYQLCDGFAVNTEWFLASLHAKGTVNSPLERYNPEKHKLVFEFHQGVLLRREIPNIQVEILGVANTDGDIAQVVDVKTGSVNDLLTPGRNLRISGAKIRIAGENTSNGVYFLRTDTGTSVKVDPSDIVVNNPSEVIIVIPDLDGKATYRLEIVTQYTISSQLKTPRAITFDKLLTVQ
jgi:hypothetical protein